MPTIEVEVKDYANAPDGSLLIKKNGKWIVTSFAELNKDNKKALEDVKTLEQDVQTLKRSSRHYVKYAKSHFLVVFNYLKGKILSGDIDVTDEEVLKLDEAVLSGKISVEEAIEKHPKLKEVYHQLYLDEKETVEFTEV